MDIEDLIREAIDAAYAVKRTLGEGFLEQVYHNAMMHELKLRGINAEKEKPLNITYKGVDVGTYRADIVVQDRLIIELKVAEAIIPAHEYQLVNYLRATGVSDGVLLNFGTVPMGIRRKFKDKK